MWNLHSAVKLLHLLELGSLCPPQDGSSILSEKLHHKCTLPPAKSRSFHAKTTTRSSKQKQKATRNEAVGLKQALLPPLGPADHQKEPLFQPTRPALRRYLRQDQGPAVWLTLKAMKNEVWGSERLFSSCPRTPICPWALGLRAAPPQHSDQGSMPPERPLLLTAQALPQDDQRPREIFRLWSRLLMAE